MTDELDKAFRMQAGQIAALKILLTAITINTKDKDATMLCFQQMLAELSPDETDQFWLGIQDIHQYVANALKFVQDSSWRTMHDYKSTP